MTIRPACLSVATAIVGLLATLAGSAPVLAQGTEEERRACTPDAMRLCREYIPNIDRIVACMVARRDELSPACQAFIKPEPAPAATVATAPAPRAVRRTASRTTRGQPVAAKPAVTRPVAAKATAAKSVATKPAATKPRATKAALHHHSAASKTAARPLNLLPAARPASAKKSPRDKQAQRTP